MTNPKQIEAWVQSGTITQKQADVMLKDVHEKGKEDRSDKLIVTISTVGSVLLGIGAILFVASNWREIPNLMKVAILLGSTFGAYYLGYLFKYDKKNLPKVGAALFFLGALLFGASIFLIAQIYHVNANAHSLVLLWLVGVLPLVYAFISKPIAALCAVLYFVWIGTYIFSKLSFSENIFIAIPVIYLFAGILLFAIGGLHYLKPALKDIAVIFRIAGIKIAMLSLFLLTFEVFSGSSSRWRGLIDRFPNGASQYLQIVVVCAILAIIGLAVNFLFNPSKSKTNNQEHATALVVVAFTLIFFFFPASSNIYNVLFNLIFAALTGYLIYMGYEKSNMNVVNIGIGWLNIFLIAKYFDFFWDLLDRSIFFMVGGLILILGGIAMEKKRRELKQNISTHTT